MQRLRIVIADDHPLVLMAMADLLKKQLGFEVVAALDTPTALVEQLSLIHIYQPITVDQLPTRVGIANAQEAGGMQEDRYRSLVYFTRDIAYSNGSLPEFAEFLWGDWLRRQVAANQLPGLDQYAMVAPATPAQILTVSTLSGALASTGANDGYAAAVRNACLLYTSGTGYSPARAPSGRCRWAPVRPLRAAACIPRSAPAAAARTAPPR